MEELHQKVMEISKNLCNTLMSYFEDGINTATNFNIAVSSIATLLATYTNAHVEDIKGKNDFLDQFIETVKNTINNHEETKND